MSDAEEEVSADAEEKKPSRVKALVLGAASTIALGGAATGAAFFLAPAAQQCAPGIVADAEAGGVAALAPDVIFVNLEPLVISLGPDAKSKYLKISLSLESTEAHEKDLYQLSPRIRDTLNTYLRAVAAEDLVRPSSMTRLRAQMLRRLQLAAPSGNITDILITEFVLS